MEEGSLYPALQRVQAKGWVKSEWRETPNRRRARYYTITAAGRKRLKTETERWHRTALAINTALGAQEA